MTRKFIHNTTITVHIKHDKDDEGVEHVDFEPILPGGLAGPLDHMALDWTLRKIEQKPFGFVITKIRRIPITDVTDEYLNSGWLPDVSRDGVIERHVEPDKERNSYSWKSHTVSPWVVYSSCVDVMMQRRSGVSKTSTASVARP